MHWQIWQCFWLHDSMIAVHPVPFIPLWTGQRREREHNDESNVFLFYCITHSCSDTCIYKYRQFFVRFFLFVFVLFIYCKRAGWKYFPLISKWERGSNVREEGQQVVWWRLRKHKKNGTGQVHKMNKWLISKRGSWWRERLWPCTHRTWIDDRL